MLKKKPNVVVCVCIMIEHWCNFKWCNGIIAARIHSENIYIAHHLDFPMLFTKLKCSNRTAGSIIIKIGYKVYFRYFVFVFFRRSSIDRWLFVCARFAMKYRKVFNRSTAPLLDKFEFGNHILVCFFVVFSFVCIQFLYLIFPYNFLSSLSLSMFSHCVEWHRFKTQLPYHSGITWLLVCICFIFAWFWLQFHCVRIHFALSHTTLRHNTHLLFTHSCSWGKNKPEISSQDYSTAAHLHFKTEIRWMEEVFLSIYSFQKMLSGY